jgi:hypothetical protein
MTSFFFLWCFYSINSSRSKAQVKAAKKIWHAAMKAKYEFEWNVLSQSNYKNLFDVSSLSYFIILWLQFSQFMCFVIQDLITKTYQKQKEHFNELPDLLY